MKEKILFCGYRDWSKDIFCKSIYNMVMLGIDDIEFILAKNSDELINKLSSNDIKTILFVGWSWIIKDEILDNYNCICLHPSPLPKYRGGCPIQHQILSGEEKSAVTLFLMDDKVDHGPVLWQSEFALSGSLDDIFLRISDLGVGGLLDILRNYRESSNFSWGIEQDHSKATYYKRRKPEESEIKIQDLKKCSAQKIYNKIRALQDPYPNAYIKCKDGRKLYLTEAHYERD